jgi:hypothetical protein
MKKLKLNIEELAVETFSADSEGTAPQRGTVKARESNQTWEYTCTYNYHCTYGNCTYDYDCYNSYPYRCPGDDTYESYYWGSCNICGETNPPRSCEISCWNSCFGLCE